jgi:hypothetical protein
VLLQQTHSEIDYLPVFDVSMRTREESQGDELDQQMIVQNKNKTGRVRKEENRAEEWILRLSS